MPESIPPFLVQFDLQIALLLIGAVLILALMLYNLSKSKKQKKQTTDVYGADYFLNKSTSGDPFLGQDASRIEPGLKDGQGQLADDLGASIGKTPDLVTEKKYISKIDPAIDCIVMFRFTMPVRGEDVLMQLQKWPSNEPFRIAVEGYSEAVNDEAKSTWETLNKDHAYRELQVSIQLANRRGPIQGDTLTEFFGLGQQLAQVFDAEIEVPPLQDVLELAQDLDQFAVQCDIQLGFSLMANMNSWGAKEIEAALIKEGLKLSREGMHFNFYADETLLFKAQVPSLNYLRDDLQKARIKQVLFTLDVPLVNESFQPFLKMLKIAQTLAQEMDGRLLDDNGQSLEPSAIESILTHLKPIYELMHSRQILPGSPTASRLFN